MAAIFFSGSRQVGLVRISNVHRAYVPLHYVLLFRLARPAQLGHLPFCRLRPTAFTDNTDNLNKRMSQAQFRSFRLHMRDSSFPSIHLGSRLFQQYMRDMWVSADQKFSKQTCSAGSNRTSPRHLFTVAWKKLLRSPTTSSICKPSVIGSYSHLRTLGASVYEPTFPSCRGDCASFRWLQSLHHANMQSFMAGHHAGIDAWSDICRQSRFDRSHFHPVQKTSQLPRVAWLAARDRS